MVTLRVKLLPGCGRHMLNVRGVEFSMSGGEADVADEAEVKALEADLSSQYVHFPMGPARPAVISDFEKGGKPLSGFVEMEVIASSTPAAPRKKAAKKSAKKSAAKRPSD